MSYGRWMAAWLLGMASAALAAQTPLRPVAVAYDTAGNLYIADAARNQVLESTVGGELRVVAGTGAQGFAGDGAAATAAMLNRPAGVAVGADGTVYVADTGNQRVRAFTAGGTIATLAGSGTKGFAGDGGAATAASFCEPSGIAIAGTSLYVADRCNQRVRLVRGGLVSTVAGSGFQGFAGDGGAATAAELNEPQAVAVDAAGRLWIADTRNDRVRVVALDGTITTSAGTGVRGFGGDGAGATLAKLSMPVGVAAMPDGSVIVADAGNQRLRSVDASGVITTIAGSGIQGAGVDGGVAVQSPLNELRGLAASAYGVPVLTDARADAVAARMSDGRLYDAAGLVPRVSAVQLTLPASATYGSVQATVNVAGHASTPQGVVTLEEANTALGTATLQAGTASIAMPRLSAGTHAVVANYAGDGFNPAAVSAGASISVAPAPVVAMATGVGVTYGQPVPALQGTATGILPQDASAESVVFSSAATGSSAPGTYPITAALAGPLSANYMLTTAPNSGSVTIAKASSQTVESSAAAYAGLPMTLTAAVAPQFAGVPSGDVAFIENGATVATGTLVGGVATAVYLAPPAGSHTITAQYAGDADFLASASAPITAVVGALPDFSMAVQGSGTQLVNAGSNAVFGVMVLPASAAFSSAVSVSVSGLPANVAVSVTPQLLIPAAGGSMVSIVVPTTALTSFNRAGPRELEGAWLPFGCVVWVLGRKRRRWALCCLGLLFVAGCGARTAPESRVAARSYTVHVTGTATSLAGTLLTHSVDLTLQVQ